MSTAILASAITAFRSSSTTGLRLLQSPKDVRYGIRRLAIFAVGALLFLLRRRKKTPRKKSVSPASSKSGNLSNASLSKTELVHEPPPPVETTTPVAALSRQFGLEDDFFELGARVSAGGQGIVYECTQLNTGDQYAAKVINFSMLADPKKQRMLLKREICIMRELHHPQIVNILVAFWEEDLCTIVMDLARGGDLYTKLEADVKLARNKGHGFRGLGGHEFVSKYVAKQLLEGISYMHLNNVVHRDLKLENILITNSYPCLSEPGLPEVHDVKIADFGLSTVLNSINGQRFASLNPMMSAVGTPAYVAPEVLEEVYDERVDYWSLGVILYAMHCGQMPFVINSLLPGRHKEAVSMIKPCDPWNLISLEGQALVRGLLRVDPAKRFNVERCMRHPWFASCFEDEPVSFIRQTTPCSAYSGEEPEIVGVVHRITGWISSGVHSAELVLTNSSVVAYGPEPECTGDDWYDDTYWDSHFAGDHHFEGDAFEGDVVAVKKSANVASVEGLVSTTFELEPTELIIGVMQSRSGVTHDVSGILGDAIVFYTSKSRVIALQGSDARHRARFVTPEGCQIVGLQFEGSWLTGTHVEPVPPSGKGSVEQLSGQTGANVDSVHIHMRNGRTHCYGSKGGQEHEPYMLKDTELIMIVEQGHRERGLGASIVFYTSHGRVLKFAGKTGASARRFAVKSKQQICGLHFEGNALNMVQICDQNGNRGDVSWHKVDK